MKVHSLHILVFLLLGGFWGAAGAQVYQTAQPVATANAYTPYTGTYSPTPINTSTADYIGAVNPYANTKFVSTSATPSSYTIAVSALDMASVGEAQDPSRSPGIMKAPPGPGDVVKDPIGDVSGGVPVGDGTWVLLLCLVLCLSLRAYQVHRTKRV
ncbi:MAG: hypothetical protein SPE88_03955 [Paludibacteraceae bacterium]|nr:hypothetical protein [Paludibacteraceae bacterium]